jgi:uncharacterized membrane protein (UPF0127 family)
LSFLESRRRAPVSLISRLAALVVGLALTAATPPTPQPQHLRTEPLAIATSRGVTHFQVQIADTDSTREKGLMFVRHLGPDEGMLFDFKTPQPVSFWMKNTFIPLDMLFIAPDGRVISIASNAVPMTETPIPSGGDVTGVLEVRGGRAAEIGVSPGDRVRARMFDK